MRLLLAPVALVSCLAAACLPAEDADPVGIPESVTCEWAAVLRVVDGDTLRVRLGGVEERLRYIGIDTPEMQSDERPAEPLAEEARDFNAGLVDQGRLCLEKDVSDRDQYRRLLRYAWLDDGRMVNEELLEAGMARVVTFPPDVRYHDARLLPAQRAASRAALGIWSD